jgi:aminoglycoside 3-N-acetyltransferase
MIVMSEAIVIGLTKRMTTVDTIFSDLLNLGIESGDNLLVYSSMSSIGWVCGAAQAVIMALQKVISANVTLIMPAHSGAVSDPADWKNPPIDK